MTTERDRGKNKERERPKKEIKITFVLRHNNMLTILINEIKVVPTTVLVILQNSSPAVQLRFLL